MFVSCFVLQYYVSFLVLQSSWWVRESWLSSWCLVVVNILWLFLAALQVGLQCVIVVFPDHTQLCFDEGVFCILYRLFQNIVQWFQLFIDSRQCVVIIAKHSTGYLLLLASLRD